MSVIAVYNIKGGVGKTATSVNLSYLSACQGNRTLLCDMDSQGSATYYFRIRPAKKFNTRKLLKGGKHIDRNIRGTDYPGLDLLPADFSYRNIDIALDDLKKSRQRISKILKPLREEYDHIFLDCPPNVTLLSENIFHAADRILVPLIPTTLSHLALGQLLDFLKEIGQDRGKVLVFFSMVEKRKKMHGEMMRLLRDEPGVLPCGIPFLADVEKMGIYRQPVAAMLPNSAAAESYRVLWDAICGELERP
ncbi:MAG TPA: ParA family protein [Desulfobulbus sp.]|nr:ParA family protein [Desulfobulbus sp.]